MMSAEYQKSRSIPLRAFQFEANHSAGVISLRAIIIITEAYVTMKKEKHRLRTKRLQQNILLLSE
jgi:hypothetical protein